jgi:hypothetical protein
MKGQHVNSRKLAGASAASVGAVTAVAALLLGTLSAAADDDKHGKHDDKGDKKSSASAFGIAADGLIDIDPTPYVDAPPDESKALLEVPGENRGDDFNIAVLKVEAEHFRSKATALKVDVLGLNLKVLEARCENGKGDSTIISTDGDGDDLDLDDADLDLSPVIDIEFNRQFRDKDRLTVQAAVIELLPGDHNTRAIGQKDLDLLKQLAPKQMKVPATMEEVKAEKSSSKPGAQPGAPTPVKPGAQPGVPVPAQPDAPKAEPGNPAPAQPGSPEPSNPGPVTVGDLMTKIKELNPNLTTPKSDDALLEIVISSASCEEDRHKDDRKKEEAPAPKPVEADLPVTH